jgi:hypothetical protein
VTTQAERKLPLPCLLLQVERWAGSHTCQALLLADAVLWTRAASQALQQLAMGNSRALRALSDAAVLRLETVSVALQGRLQSGSQHTATKAPSAAAGAAASGAPGKLGGSGSSAAGASSRSSSCATSETCPSWQETASSDSHKQHHVQVLVVQHGSKEREHLARDKQDCVPQKAGTLPATGIVVGAAAAAAQRITTHGGSSSGTACNDSAHPDQQPAVQLSQQQVLGLQALVSAAACHRDVAATLIAASSSGRTPHEEWGKQLRHYWQPDTQELQVGTAGAHVEVHSLRVEFCGVFCKRPPHGMSVSFVPALTSINHRHAFDACEA